MVQIANPIYDAVFKYLMNDNKVAKLLLSAIIQQEIIELKFRATEHSLPLKESLTVLRMDFNALVRYEDGTEQLIIIELQKAKLHTDIMRFRRYLGQQYADQENAREIEEDDDGKILRKRAFPILSIYFLGHTLDYHKQVPIIRIARQYIDVSTGKVLQKREEFGESLTHDSIIIQIPALRGKRSTELEQVLSIFDQANRSKDYHVLNIKEEDFPERYRPVVRRLLSAFATPKLRDEMYMEDDILEEMQNYVRVINKKEEKIQQQEKTLKEQEKAIKNAIASLRNAGLADDEIATTLGIPLAQIRGRG